MDAVHSRLVLRSRNTDVETVAAVDRLADRLPTARELRVVVDGESVALPPLERIDADVRTARLPFVDGTVGLELRWSGEDLQPPNGY